MWPMKRGGDGIEPEGYDADHIDVREALDGDPRTMWIVLDAEGGEVVGATPDRPSGEAHPTDGMPVIVYRCVPVEVWAYEDGWVEPVCWEVGVDDE